MKRSFLLLLLLPLGGCAGFFDLTDAAWGPGCSPYNRTQSSYAPRYYAPAYSAPQMDASTRAWSIQSLRESRATAVALQPLAVDNPNLSESLRLQIIAIDEQLRGLGAR